MSAEARYSAYHPKWYRRPMSLLWWLHNRSYFMFAMRELTSVFVGFVAFVYLWQLRALVQGPEAYARVIALQRAPLFVAINVVALVFVLYHAITWFNLAPKAMVVRVGGRRMPDWVIAALHYGGCLVLSGAVAWVLLRG